MDRKQLRRAMSPAGWIMVLYYLLLNACVLFTMVAQMLLGMIASVSRGDLEGMMDAVTAAASSAWGYFVAAAVGVIILLAWKKPRFWKEEIWAKGKPMKAGDFFGILCVFLGTQLVYQLMVMGLEFILNCMGLSIMVGMETMSLGTDGFSMFLYAGVLAPVSEELLCRGLVQRTLMPYGKKLAILGSAFLFGIFHGNIIQTPFAFATGLVLGYVAAEYSIAWAMLLHMINNLVVADMLTRLTSGMPEEAAGIVVWAVLLFFAAGALVTLIRRRRAVRTWMQRNVLGPTYVRCFFGSAGVITFTVLMVLSMIGTCFILITPL